MTETTDTKALRVEIAELRLEIAKGYDRFIPETKIHIKLLERILDQLEAERQQREAAEKERDRLLNQEFQQRLANAEHQLEMKDLAIRNVKASRMAQFKKRKTAEAELAELRGTQEPVAYLTRHMGCRYPDDCEEYLEVSDKDGVSGNGEAAIPVFTRPPKPVVVRPNLHPSHSYASLAVSSRDEQWFSALEAAGIVVKDGE